MKIAQEATQGIQNGKSYPNTTYARSVEFERLLKPFKGYVSGGLISDFARVKGGAENA
jgi:hypothetical protein